MGHRTIVNYVVFFNIRKYWGDLWQVKWCTLVMRPINSKTRLEASKRFQRPIVTQVVPASDFWKAEEYHQQYNEKRKTKIFTHM